METGSIKIVIEEGKTPTIEAQLVNNNLWLAKYEIARLLNCFNQKIEMNLRSIFKSHLLWEEDVTTNPAHAGFYVHLNMARCILSSSKYFQYLKILALAEGKNASEVSVFNNNGIKYGNRK